MKEQPNFLQITSYSLESGSRKSIMGGDVQYSAKNTEQS